MAQEIPRQLLDRYTETLNKLSDAGRAQLALELAKVNFSNLTAAATECVSIMENICATFSETAANISAVFYRGMSLAETGEDFDSEGYSDHLPGGTEKATRGIFEQVVKGDYEEFARQLGNRVAYEIVRAAGQTTVHNGNRDRRRVKYARVPTGPETCNFCIMLASRGFTYLSPPDHYHANCDCRVVPSWGDWIVSGYNPDEYYRQYLLGPFGPQSDELRDQLAHNRGIKL